MGNVSQIFWKSGWRTDVIILIIFLFALIYLAAAWKSQCRKNRLLTLQKRLDVINLGSTYAYYDFSYEETELAGGNLANVPQYLDMDWVLLRKYIKRVKANGKVFIVLPNFVFASGGGSYNRKVYYEALHFWEIKNFNIGLWMKCVWKAAKEPFTHAYRAAEEKWKGYVASSEEKKRHAQKRVSDWEGKLGIPDVRTGQITDELKACIEKNKEIVFRMIKLCRERSVEPVLIVPPVSEIMKQCVSDECLEVYLRSPIRQIAEKEGVRVYDYMNREELWDEGLYLNSDCLNEKGRKVLMKLVLQDIYNK